MSEMMCPAAENERMNMKYFCFCLVIKQQKNLSSGLRNVRNILRMFDKQKKSDISAANEPDGFFHRMNRFTGRHHMITVLFPELAAQK